MNKGIKLQKELARGSKGAKKEAAGKSKVDCGCSTKNMECGGMVKKGKK